MTIIVKHIKNVFSFTILNTMTPIKCSFININVIFVWTLTVSYVLEI